MNLAASTLVYGGLLLALTGSAALLRPLRALGLEGRGAALLLASGLAAALVGLVLPARRTRSTGHPSRLDEFLPAYEFHEAHEVTVRAPPGRVYRALKEVTADEILFFRTLAWIRSPRLPWAGRPREIFAPPARQPILDVFLRSGFLLLSEEPGREIVLGTIVCCGPSGVGDPRSFAELDRPGFVKAALNFTLEDGASGGTRVRTETRVYATDVPSLRRFRVYWRFIYPGSALLRRTWLRAVKRRAERID